MTVADILRVKGNEVVTVKHDVAVSAAASTLLDHGIGAIVVLNDENSRQASDLAGILSERDIVRAIATEGTEALKKPVSEFMTLGVVTCTPSEPVEKLMEIMTNKRLRHLPIIDNGQMCGIVSIGDVVKQRIADAERDAKAMRDYIATG